MNTRLSTHVGIGVATISEGVFSGKFGIVWVAGAYTEYAGVGGRYKLTEEGEDLLWFPGELQLHNASRTNKPIQCRTANL
jgi:hypothetical protein